MIVSFAGQTPARAAPFRNIASRAGF